MKQVGHTHLTNKEQHTVRFVTSFSNTVLDVFLARGWVAAKNEEEGNNCDWDIMWADREWVFEVLDSTKTKLKSGQKLNHFRNSKELCRKDLLIKNLKSARRQLERNGNRDEAVLYDFVPITFNLPKEYSLFVEEFKKRGGLWIMKPIGAAQGRGIFIFSKLSDIKNWKLTCADKEKETKQVEAYIVQQYISNPYLVGGKKFDLRLYVLVTCFSPLTIWLYRGGFCRFSNKRYNADTSDIADNLMHLTNVSIQKTGNYDKRTGGKWDLKMLRIHMFSQFGGNRVDKLFLEIQDILIRSLKSVKDAMINNSHCFELYGFDVMIDNDLKPWLIEANASPSLSASTEYDYELKSNLLNATLDVLDMEGENDADGKYVCGFDLVFDESADSLDESDIDSKSYLGGTCNF